MTMRNLLFASCGLAMSLSAPGAALASVELSASLSGANETKPGDPDGSGSFTAEVDADTGDVCYVLSVKNVANVTAAHIHAGAAGKDGKPVAALDVTGPDDDLCIAVEPDKLAEIVTTPANFYVNVHSAEFPAGAVRGQLSAGGGASAPAPTAAEALENASEELEEAAEAVEEAAEAVAEEEAASGDTGSGDSDAEATAD